MRSIRNQKTRRSRNLWEINAETPDEFLSARLRWSVVAFERDGNARTEA